jgi:cell wall-associated NlpC family hydrolase
MTGAAGRVAAVAVAVLVTAAAVLTAGLPTGAPAPTAYAVATVPAGYLALYEGAASLCPGLPWTLLAGVGEVESDHGRVPSLVSATGARGPMQFEPGTWVRYGIDGNGDGRADPTDPADAIAAAARYLCVLGAVRDPSAALVAYNCGNTGPGYAAQVLGWAAQYGRGAPSPAALVAVRAALSQLGTPYAWGGETTGGFDCSGLVQWAFAHAGLLLPRVAQAQFDAGPRLPPVAPLLAGDLVFFGASTRAVTHVGIYLGDGRLVDAPHPGAAVRVDVLAGFTPGYLGATRPGGAAP